MARAILTACLPWLALLVVLILAAWVLVRFSRAQLRLGRLLKLHRDEAGSVQSLSFVLTLPLFIMIMMMIVQVSQLMIGTVVVHYAAFAAARSAAVWIPAAMAEPEGPCCISSYAVDPDAPDQVTPELDPTAADYGPGSGGLTYKIEPGSPKFNKIASAAILACVPISPSRDLGLQAPTAAQMDSVLKEAYGTLSPSSAHQRRHRPAAGPQAGLCHAEHRRADPLLPQESRAAAADVLRAGRSRRVLFQRGRLAGHDHGDGELSVSLAARPGADAGAVRRRAQRDRQGGGSDPEARRRLHLSLAGPATIGNEGEKSVVTYVYQ